MTTAPETTAEPPAAAPGSEPVEAPRSMLRRGWEVFAENRLALVAVGLLVAVVGLCFLGPLFYHSDTSVVNLTEVTLPPGAGHPLGTDNDGVDELGKLLAGGQTSLEIGLAAGLIAAVVGALYGAIAGYLGGWVDALMMRVIDSLMSFPLIFLLIYLSSVYGKSKEMLILEVGLTFWFGITRLVRGEALAIKVRDYVAASRMMGAGARRIIFRHILPNTVGTTIVNTTFSIADAVFAMSTLSYIGLGLQAPNDDLGGMLNIGTNYASQGYWWMIYPPAVLIILIILCFNIIGDALRDAFESRLQKR
ncbi:peptide/nickel transport system permease protein [Kitasatospora sp. MAP12-15]|uniref:ABC transporter permease n=1 Tax=unclassified Kitasatospora TaxID=2633591 RepID=UPI002473AA33|nr:ABC transporter permease [Kitasatospora sp. MAP12-44]MDH6115011.1 peptide/nickel transport system permease protein [Kitasatospora sp. MAP12-44]